MKFKSVCLLLLIGTLSLPSGLAKVSEAPSLENLAVPESLGKIESQFKGAEGRWVVHIQDVHAHLTAQQNIAALLEHLQQVYNIQTVAVEGSWLDSTLPKSWAVPQSRQKQMLADALLEEDYIDGAIYAATFSKNPFHLVGLEEESLYWENGRLYLDYLKHREDTLEKLGVLEQKIQAAKENAYNPDLLKFDQALVAFREGKKIAEFLPLLLELAKTKEMDLSDLTQLQTFQKAFEIEKGLDKEKLRKEGERLKAAFKNTGMNFEELIKNGKIPADKLEFYPQAANYAKLLEVQKQIHHRDFFSEIETAVTRLKERLAGTSGEKSLAKRSEAFYLAKKIMTLQATPSEVAAFDKIQLDLAADLQQSALDDSLQTGLKFYETAHQRDVVFTQKILQDSKLQGNIAVITGGFHTEGLTEQLEKNGVSYTVISPQLANEPVNEPLYHKRMMETLTATQTFKDVPYTALSKQRDEGFAQGVQELITSNNIAKAMAAYLTFQIGAPAEAGAAAAEISLEDFTDEMLRERLTQTTDEKVVAIAPLSQLMTYLKDAENGEFNKAALMGFIENPKNVLILLGDVEAIDPDLIGKRNVRILQNDLETTANREASKLTKDSRLGVVAEGFSSSNSKVISIKPYAGIFGAVRLILTDSRFASPGAVESLMERAVAILQEIYGIRAQQASA